MQERLLALTRDKYSFLQSEAVKSLAGAVAHPQVQQRLFAVTWQLEWGLDYFLFFILPMIGFALGYEYSLGFLIIFKWVGIWGMLLYPIALLGMFLVPGIVYIVIKCIYLFWVDPCQAGSGRPLAKQH